MSSGKMLVSKTISKTILRGSIVFFLAASPILAQEACQFIRFDSGDPQVQDLFGNAMDIEDGRLVIASSSKSFPGMKQGSIYVYDLCSSNWVLTEMILQTTIGAIAFGIDVKLNSSDLVVGASRDSIGGSNAGAAHIYRRVGEFYEFQDVVVPSVPFRGMHFGSAVAFDSSNRVIVGAPRDGTLFSNNGVVYIFEELSGVWTETQRILSPSLLASERFGDYVDTRSDGLMAVGATTTGDIEANLGTVYIYSYQDGQGYVFQQRLNPSDTADGWQFGRVAFGDTCLAVGAPLYDSPSGGSAGAVFLFDEDQGVWSETNILLPSDSATGAQFGTAVAIDGEWMAVGAGGDSGTVAGAGAVYLFQNIAGVWVEMNKLVADDAGIGDGLGDGIGGVAVALDGDIVAAGAPEKDDGAMDAGAAYAWSISGLGCSTLIAQPEILSLSAGGVQNLSMNVGANFAGSPYFLIGSAAGTAPGFFFAGTCVPLNPDSYFLSTLAPNTPPLSNSSGRLNSSGMAQAQFTLPANSDPSLAGLQLEHLFVVFSLSPLSLDHVSIPARLILGI